jgi:tetratricopeptide (TPR) repeat protein
LANGQFDLAEPIFQNVLELRRESLDENDYGLLDSMEHLARCYLEQGKTAEALPLLQEALRQRTETLGESHPATLVSLGSMASWYRADGQLEEARKRFEKLVELRRIRLGEHHELTYSAIQDLGAIYFDLKQFDKAKPLLEQAQEGLKNELDNEHPKLLQNMQNLAVIYFETGDSQRATELLGNASKLIREKLPLKHPSTVSSLNNLSNLLLNKGKYEAATEPRQLFVEALTQARGPDDPRTLNATAELGVCYSWATKYDKAIEALESVLQREQRIQEFDYYQRHLRSAYARGGFPDKFQPIADKDLGDYRENLEPSSAKLRGRLCNLGLDCLFARNYEMAKDVLTEALEILEEEKRGDFRLPNTRTMLGEALMGLGDLDTARPLLESSYDKLKEHQDSMHPLVRGYNMIEAAERLLRFYEKVDEQDGVERMELELQELRSQFEM